MGCDIVSLAAASSQPRERQQGKRGACEQGAVFEGEACLGREGTFNFRPVIRISRCSVGWGCNEAGEKCVSHETNAVGGILWK